MTAPRRRWSFSLRTLFVVVTALACWLGWNANLVANRKAAIATIASHGGYIQDYKSIARVTATGGDCAVWITKAHARPKPMNSPLRKWLGDIDAAWVLVGRESDVELARESFPEVAEVVSMASDDSPAAQADRP